MHRAHPHSPPQETAAIDSATHPSPATHPLPAARNQLRLLPLLAATYFMVAGGPYGLEDIIGKAGYARALLLLAIIPLLWSLPTALMVGELASAIPDEGGFYVWVRRALGRFWGFQEAWLSLAASVFDMAIYPTLFVLYLTRLAPAWTAGYRGTLWALAIVLGCALWNLTSAKAVGQASIALFCVLLAPFVLLIAAALWTWHGHGTGALLQSVRTPDLAGAISVTLWNYMGWDNSSTVAGEVHNPQRNYPRAMLGATLLVAVTYILPLAAVALAGLAPGPFSTGAWTDAARTLAGPLLALSIVIGGMLNGVAMFNPLVMSYSRVPFAMASDGLLPRALPRRTKLGVPWLSVLLCAAPGPSPCASPSSASSPSTSSSTAAPSSSNSSPSSSSAAASPISIAPSASPEACPAPSRSPSAPPCSSPTPSGPPATNKSSASTPCSSQPSSPSPEPSSTPQPNSSAASPPPAHKTNGPCQQPSPPTRAILHPRPPLRLRLGLRALLLLLERRLRLGDQSARRRRIAPSAHLHPLALQVLIDREKVLDLPQNMRIHLRIIRHIGIPRIALAHRTGSSGPAVPGRSYPARRSAEPPGCIP